MWKKKSTLGQLGRGEDTAMYAGIMFSLGFAKIFITYTQKYSIMLLRQDE